jgi:hypothetical protein
LTIDKDNVESIIGDMMYSCANEEEANGNHDEEEVPADNSNGDGEEDGSVAWHRP